MKQFFTLLLTFCLPFTVSAQYDSHFYFPEKKWENIDTVKHESFFIKTGDIKLSGIILKPKRKHPIATIMFFHGGGGNVTTYVPMVKPYADNGFQVYMIDFRGFGKSTGTPTHLNIAHDAQVVFNDMIQRKDVKHTRIIIYGVSIGAEIATKIAKDNQDKITALMLEAPASSFTDLAADISLPKDRDYIKNNVPSPYAAKEDIKSLYKIPKLIIHSMDDKDVPLAEGILIYNNAPIPKAFRKIKGGHLEGILYYRKNFINAMKALAEGKLPDDQKGDEDVKYMKPIKVTPQ